MTFERKPLASILFPSSMGEAKKRQSGCKHDRLSLIKGEGRVRVVS
jgi:hypothetical protein